MAREIERKFLVRGTHWRTIAGEPQAFRQFYLARREGFSVRIRVVDETAAFLTLKTGNGFSRGEFEYPIPLSDAADLQADCIGTVIEKRRFRVGHGRHVIEVDVFGGALAPLVVAEIELASETDEVALPDWVGREVTGDPAYSNAALAKEGLPQETAS